MERGLGMFGKLLSTIIEVAKLPVDVAVDTVMLVDIERKPFKNTRERVENVQDKLEDL